MGTVNNSDKIVCSDYFVVDNLLYMGTVNKKQYIAVLLFVVDSNNQQVRLNVLKPRKPSTVQLTLGIYSPPLLNCNIYTDTTKQKINNLKQERIGLQGDNTVPDRPQPDM